MSAFNDTCNLGPLYWRMVTYADYVAYDILPPTHIALGLPGHILSLIAFCKQSKKEKAYVYQIYSICSEILNLVAFTTWVYPLVWSGYMYKEGVEWFVVSYPLMFYASHLAIPTLQTSTTNSLLSSLIMAIDRVLAMAIPFKYKNFDHKRHQVVAFSTCILLSVSTSAFNWFTIKLETNLNEYKVSFDQVFSKSTLAIVSSHLRNIVRTLGVVALIVCNVLMVYFYKKRMKQVNQMVSSNNQKEAVRKSQEKALLLLTLSQSMLTTVSIFAQVVLLYLIYGIPTFVACGYLALMAPIVDGTIQIANVLEFYLALVISKQFRRVVGSVLPCVKQTTSISTVGQLT